MRPHAVVEMVIPSAAIMVPSLGIRSPGMPIEKDGAHAKKQDEERASHKLAPWRTPVVSSDVGAIFSEIALHGYGLRHPVLVGLPVIGAIFRDERDQARGVDLRCYCRIGK